MINSEQIIYYAVKWQTSEINIAREYIQHRFLNYFYQQPQSQSLLFKGGTALRLVFESQRFSEDLDFTALKLDYATIEQIIIDTLDSLQKESLNGDLQEAKTTTGGYLAIINFPIHDRVIDLSLQMSLRKSPAAVGELANVKSEISPAYSLWQLDTKQLVAEKIQATLTRQKPRDFFDIYFLLRANLIEPSQKRLLNKVGKLLETTAINFSAELKQFLPASLHPLIKHFKKSLSQELRRGVSGFV